MSSRSRNQRVRRFWRVLTRSAAIVAIGSALGLLSNALHPMGLPLLLGEIEGPGIPVWTWNAVEMVDPGQACTLWEGHSVLFVDARDRSDYAQAHIPGSISLPYHEFTATDPLVRDRLPQDGPILIYCHDEGCPLGMRVAKQLLRMGHDKLILLSGGIIAWRNAGYDLTVQGTGTGETAGGEAP